MTAQQAVAFGILPLTLAMFIWGRWRYDLVAIFSLLAVVLTGLVPADQAFLGFAHPAVITVAAVLVIGRGLENSGLGDALIGMIAPMRGREILQLAAQCLGVALLSTVMNNVGALAIMLPVALRNAYRDGYSPAKSLMPLAFASLLGGLVTLIGTPPNIIIATFRANHSGQPFGMFDFVPAGGAVALAGLAFLVLVGWRLLPLAGRRPQAGAPFSVEGYVTEADVPEDSKAVGMTIFELEQLSDNDAIVAGLVHGDRRSLVPGGAQRLRSGDVIMLRGDTESLRSMISAAGLTLAQDRHLGREDLKSQDIDLVEAVVGPESGLIGTSPISSRLRTVHGINLIAISRQGQPINTRLGHLKFRAGDVILIQGPRSELTDIMARLQCLPLAPRSLGLGQPRRLLAAGALFALAIGLVIAGLLPAPIAFTGVAAIYVATNIVRPTEVYTAIDWPVIVLIGAMLSVGGALQETGGPELIADAIIRLTEGHGVVWALLVILLGSMLVSDVINNSATAVLMAPIALSVAVRMGVNPDSFLMAVAIGSSSSFLTPIGHQSNTLVMGPGGYRFGDYWRVGLPLDGIIILIALPAIMWFWPP